MRYRPFGKLDAIQGSALGFGCMRLPTTGEYKDIDEPEARAMIRYAIDHGLSYLDSGYTYHGGNSERFLGRALQDGYREKVYLATKQPCWLVEAYADFDRLLGEQLEKLQTSHIDFYLLHGLNRDRWSKVRDLRVLEWAEGALADGRIGHLGFSFHDGYDVFREIIDAYDGWSLCQIQYNYLNEETQAGTRGLEYAASKGLGVVIMEPLLGGRLANPPKAIQSLLEAAPTKRSPADWALQWLWNKPEVSLVLSGMSTMEQVQQNLASADASGPHSLSPEELEVIGQVRDEFRELFPVPCTDCRYCLPCPNGVNIPRNFAMLNDGVVYGELDRARENYANMPEDQRASACIQCRECEDKCPQRILISEEMSHVHEVLGAGR